MFKQIRTSKASKVIACYLAIMLFVQLTQPMAAYALTEGPSQPEFNSFTPIGTSDMVDLASGDFNYNIPIMDVGGYPINLAYNSGVTMDQEASWVGLGWNLNIGQINRNVRGLPDDFKGDEMITYNNMKTNVTVGVNPYLNLQIIGALDGVPGLTAGAGLDVSYNNYNGINAVPSFGASFKLSDYVSVGMQLSSSVENGASVSPSVSISTKKMDKDAEGNKFTGTISPSVTYNSRQGLQSFNLSSTAGVRSQFCDGEQIRRRDNSSSGSGSISFVNNTFTPNKRLAFKNNSIRFSYSGGVDLWGVHGEISIAGYASVQKLVDKHVVQSAYGYENTELAGESGLLDFNREKEQGVISKNTLVLPVTNYTYDIYSIQGQGIGGTFRPFRGQVGYLYDGRVTDQSSSNSLGFEIEAGAGGHYGLNFRTTNTNSYTGSWNTRATNFLKEKISGNKRDYEKVFFKSVGETRVDLESSIILNSLGNSDPITLKLDSSKDAVNNYLKKVVVNNESTLNQGTPFNTSIKRTHRELRNQSIQKISKRDAKLYGLSSFIKYNTETENGKQVVPNHHTAGYIITDENGSRHIFGDAAYNKKKKEVTFNVGKNQFLNKVDNNRGLVRYSGSDNTPSNSKGRDHYFNSVETPDYAHTYLLTSILSNDYSDITGNGPTDDDLGTYTKFDYEKKSANYKWRVPISRKEFNWPEASYNEGTKTDEYDQKGSYLYGEKEMKYIKRIVTKTHVAYFDLEERLDGLGVSAETGFVTPQSDKMFRIKKIRLYSKPEILANGGSLDNPNNNIKPIKTAHFEYDYSLCQGVDNNINDQINEKGKLTLKKVFFTYRDSNMGKYTPYEFFYGKINPDGTIDGSINPNYHVKAYDIWGNYKPFVAGSWSIDSEYTTPQEFPYVDQIDRTKQNQYASAWSLTEIKLPSGGKIKIEFEADDYQYVQDKKAMQMFKVHGVTDNPTNYNGNSTNNFLYTNGSPGFDAKYVVIKLPESAQEFTQEQLRRKYTDGLVGKPIYFNFLMNMTDQAADYDYVSGYFEMDDEALVSGDNEYLFIPMKKIDREGKNSSSGNSNPISVAGWFFGRQNLNPQVNGLPDPTGETPPNVVDVANSILSNLGVMTEIFKGPNGRLKQDFNCARMFKPNKSWIRLLEPTGSKIGGGCRVKSVLLHDEWDKMLSVDPGSNDIDRYRKQYGQEYSYLLNDSTSSGVATYEPNMCKENPLVIPFYHKPEKLTAQSYQEKPFGESFYPSPTITYSKVSVKNLTASPDQPTRSGKVVTNHYTSYDFPTKTDFTNLDKSKIYNTNENQFIGNMLKGLLGMRIDIKTDLTLTQGFVIETNDMNGKLKKQEVLNHADALISSVEYIYSTNSDDASVLKNKLPTINEKGEISEEREIATHYDVINDFKESYNNTSSFGMAVNIDYIPLAFIPIIIGWAKPELSTHKQVLHTAVTTKVIHRSGVLKEKRAFDLGSMVYTKNHAWDAKTGQVLLTETINEYDDKYFSFNFPAYWHYKEMGMASERVGISGIFDLSPVIEGNKKYFKVSNLNGNDISKYLKPGDELVVNQQNYKRVWVYGYNSSNTAVRLMKANGEKIESLTLSGGGFFTNYIPYFSIIRPSYRNQQMASMASVTLMKNPIRNSGGVLLNSINESFLKTNNFDPRVINSSAIEYNQNWASQCENGLPQPGQLDINDYLFNIKGLWRPVKSYAYLTGRNSQSNAYTRNAGFYKSFNPFYKLTSQQQWVKDFENWTYASEVTQYNPHGVEIENKDALNRHSSAQYGYEYKLPVAVASNSTYKEMGYDGFEDYSPLNTTQPSSLRPHFGFNEHISGNASISDKASHTGKKSIRLQPNTTIELKRKIEACDTIPINVTY